MQQRHVIIDHDIKITRVGLRISHEHGVRDVL